MIFVDTNYFLRFLLKDVQKQHLKAKELFLKGAKGQLKLFTSSIVIFEIYWVLASLYQKRKDKIIDILKKIFDLEFVEIEGKRLLNQALKIYKKSNLDVEDCYNLALAKEKGIKEFKTFDRRLKKEFDSYIKNPSF